MPTAPALQPGGGGIPRMLAAELHLPDRVFATFGLAVGVPDPTESAGIKPRLPQRAVLHREVYDDSADTLIGDYDARLAECNAEHGSSAGWITPVPSRLESRDSLKGRHRLREYLNRQGPASQ